MSKCQDKRENSDKGPKVRFTWIFFWFGKIDSISSLIIIFLYTYQTSKKQLAGRREWNGDDKPAAKKSKQENRLWIFFRFGKISTTAFSNNISLTKCQDKRENSDKGCKVGCIWKFFLIGKIDNISSLIIIFSNAIFSYELNQSSLQSQQHMASQILRHQKKIEVGYCGIFSKIENFPDATNKLIVQPAASISPRQKVI